MAFETGHESIQDSTPIYLYKFTKGSIAYRYNSGSSTKTVGGFAYEPYAGISHTEISNSGEDAKNACTITLGYDEPLAAWLRVYVPTERITVEIDYYEILEDATGFEFSGVYMKYVTKYPDIKLTFSPLDYTIEQSALQKSYSLTCQHTQYDVFCGLSELNFLVSTIILTYTESTDIIDVTPTDLNTVNTTYYVGGYIEITGVSGKERAWVVDQTQFTLTIDRKMEALTNGRAINIIPSCKGSFDSCKDPALFNNRIRFLGAPHADKVNPFDNTGVRSDV